MDTKPLENFAKAARRELIAAVEARVSAVLAAGSVARSERAETVRLLESEIAEHGREHVIDRVAYTWFNRLIALRFMDARGYTDTGVVSPESGQAHGQPEILADAKRGVLDTEVVTNAGAREAIVALLDGSRRSTDAEGEAYALLLTEYCRHWHKTMPFMFEAEGAYTELLVPAGLLAQGAVMSRAREVLTEEVCDDVEVIGWLYQFYISERKEQIFAGFKKNKKAGSDEIPAATQLFTPHWIVRYLLENSLGRLWMLNRPASRLVDQMDYYIAPIDEETDFLKISGPEELTVIDPACGSGHMLTYAFDLLYAIYEEEGYAPSDIPNLILTHNLHGTEIDPRAGALAAFALTIKARAKDRRFFARSEAKPKICVIEPISFTPDELNLLISKDGDSDAEEAFWNQFRDADTFGSLIQPDADATAQAAVVLQGLKDQEETLYYDTVLRAHRAFAQAEILSRRYSVAVANPPYMGGKNLSGPLSDWLKGTYPRSSTDLYAAFIERSIELTHRRGLVAMITMHSWMFLSTSRELRSRLLSSTTMTVLAHLGTRAFDSVSGEIVSTVAFILANRSDRDFSGLYIRLTGLEAADAKKRAITSLSNNGLNSSCFTRSAAMFEPLPGSRLIYWLGTESRRILAQSEPVESVAPAIQGMITGANSRFLRIWHEVSLGGIEFRGDLQWSNGRRWAPYNKGGESRRWYGAQSHIVNWSNRGMDFVRNRSTNSQFYFREYLSWTYRSSDEFSPRIYPAGFLWDVAGSGVFPARRETTLTLLGLLGSSAGSYIMKCLNPTSTFQVENVLEMPMISGLEELARDTDLAGTVERAVQISKSDWDRYETSWGFASSPLIGSTGQLESKVSGLYETCSADRLELANIESEIDKFFEALYFPDDSGIDSGDARRPVTLTGNYFDAPDSSPDDQVRTFRLDAVSDLISYAVGCMFGRYSLDKPGLILADQGATLQDYLAKVGLTRSAADVGFMPDADNVIPFIDDGWFEDDVVERFRTFLKAAFGTEHLDENLRFVEESLGVKTLRDYFITKSGRSRFYDDHVKRYKKRPIYWMFSSPKGSFNALIYLHRYTQSTVSTVLNEYLREYQNKLQKALERAEVAAAAGSSAKDQKEADRLRKVLAELRDYEHDVLYPLATQQVEIDLDDGVKVNYTKFYPAVKKIAGLGASDG